MENKDASREGQQILAQLCSHEAPSSWQVFRFSQKKLVLLIFSFCFFISLLMGLLALYVFGNPDHHPPAPPGVTQALIIIMLGFLVSAFLLSMTVWMTMKNRVLVLTPEALVQGDRKKPRSTFYMAYQNIAAIYVDGSTVVLQSKREKGRKKQIDCRLFEISPQVLAHDLLAAYEDFKASHAHRNTRRH